MSLPSPPVELPVEPSALINSILPDRIMPALIPRLASYATRVTVKTAAVGDIPATTLQQKLAMTSISPENHIHEVYLLMRDGDPEAVMDIIETEEGVWCNIGRLCGAAVDIFLDDILVTSFPEVSGAGPWTGFTAFEFKD